MRCMRSKSGSPPAASARPAEYTPSARRPSENRPSNRRPLGPVSVPAAPPRVTSLRRRRESRPCGAAASLIRAAAGGVPLRRDSPPRPRKEASHAAGAAGSHIPRAAASHVPVWRRVTSPGGGGGDSEIIGPVCRRRPCQPRWKGRANSARAARDPYRPESVGRGPAGTCRRAGDPPRISPTTTVPPIVTCPSLHQDISEPTPAGG